MSFLMTLSQRPRKPPKSSSLKKLFTITLKLIILLYFTRKKCQSLVTSSGVKRDDTGGILNRTALHAEAINDISADKIRENLEYFAGNTHFAGSEESYQQALRVQEQWLQYGFDKANIKKYNVLLSVPGLPGSVVLRDESGAELFRTAAFEKILDPAENNSQVMPPYSAFSPSGKVKGKLVYAYYGSSKDFARLKEQGVNVTGKIAIIRYGRGGRGMKIAHAAKNGAVGVILYSDPEDFARDGLDKVYPDYNWLPKTGIPRGSVKISKGGGDLLTPGFPSVDGIYRRPILDIQEQVPEIPVLPISYGDAERLMSTLTGELPRFYWRGDLPIMYGVQTDDTDTREVTLTVHNQLVRRDIYNVIGYIRGHEEPDHLVILGNHRDAWVFGGTDPSSGTAAMMEIARVLGALIKKGWKPRRTIVFGSWDAEESGLIGSTEWIEEQAYVLTSRAVAYLNVDMAVDGNNTLLARSMPLLDCVIMEASKKVPSPNGVGSAYDHWLQTSQGKPDLPKISPIITDSDYSPFYNMIGVTSADIRYSFNKSEGPGNPLYHTLHDTYRLLSKLVDPDFKHHQATARVWAQIALSLADSIIIPFNLSHYAYHIGKYRDKLKIICGEILRDNNVSLDYLDDAVQRFVEASKKFEDIIQNTSESDSLNIRLINERLVALEKAFIYVGDIPILPDTTTRRHVLLSRSRVSDTSVMPGITDAVRRAKRKGSWENVKLQISIVVFSIHSAVNLLNLDPI